MSKIEVVRATIEDIDEIMYIEENSFSIPWSRQSVITEIKVNEFAIYFSAKIDGKTIGYAGMWHICDEGHITNIAVHPDFRKLGVGYELLNKLVCYAEDKAILYLDLEVRKSNIAAQKLYEKCGFVTEGYRKAYYADNNEDALIMIKRTQIVQ